MATGTGPCRSAPADQSPHELGEDDLKVVFKALHSVAVKYVFLGLEMNIKMNDITEIQSQCSDPRRCLLEVLSVRLKQIPPLTWRDIRTALRSDTVGEPGLADRIRKQYGHLYSPDPSSEDSFDQRQRRKMSKSKKKMKKEKPSRKYTRDSDEKSKRYRKPSEKLQMNVNEAVLKKTQQTSNKSPYSKRYFKPEKEKGTKYEGKTKIKKRATNDKESEVVCGSQDKHKMKHSQKEVQIESECEPSVSSSENEKVQGDNSDSTEGSYSTEQEEDSAEEVSETERYQKPSEQSREDEYPHSHRETPVRMTKGKRKFSALEKSKYESQSKPEGKAKQKINAADQSVSIASQHEMAGDAYGKCERVAQECKKEMSEKHSKNEVQKAPRENKSESSAMRREEKRVSSSYHSGESRKPKSSKDTHQQKQSQRKKLEYQTKATAKKEVEKVVKDNVPVAEKQSSDKVVVEEPGPKPFRQKVEQTMSESDDESSSASTSDDGSELHLHETTRLKEYNKVHPNICGNEIEKERAGRTKKKTKVTKQKGLHSSDTHNIREQSKEVETSTKVNQKTNKGRYLKADTGPRKEREGKAEKERISSNKKVIERDICSGSSPEGSKDEESDSDDSSENEEDRDSEQNEEEETEPDEESSPDTSEEEVKRKPAVPYMKERVKEIGGKKGKRVKIAAADVPDLPGNEDKKSWDQEKHDIQPKKRSRRRHRESSISPTARGSSSPSTSQEENEKQRRKGKQEADPGRKKKKRVKKKKVERFSSTETDDSSPESEMLRSLTEAETKNLIKVFKCFFGRLCCAIKDPVETAAQLQAKRLISRSTIENIITSPESQQVKAITLVRALDKKMKQRPDKFFIIIKLFLKNKLLQKVGRQMLIETGNYYFLFQ